MASIFDIFSGKASPEQTQGLLGLAQGLLAASGPSRVPVSFGQALGNGLAGMQQGQEAARAQQMQALQSQLMGFKIKDAESDLQSQQAARARAKELADFYRNRGAGGPQGAGADPAAILGGNAAPTVANAQQLEAAQAPAQAGTSGANGVNQRIYLDRINLAQDLRARGFAQEADAAEASALKFQPQVDSWKEVQVGNETRALPVFKDGTYGVPVPLQLAVKLEQMKNGGSTDLYNPMTGGVVRSVKATMAPGEAERIGIDRAQLGLSAQRLAMEKAQIGKPAYNAEAGGFILPPTAANPTGKLIPLAGSPGKAPTEFQGKSAAFGVRAAESHKIINKLVAEGVTDGGLLKDTAEGVPLIGGGLGKAINALPEVLGGPSSKQQRYGQAKRDFINATLRQESGAAIGLPEYDNADKQYFPQPGDSAEVVAQKAKNRELVIQGFDSNAGRAAIKAKPGAAPASGVKFLGFE